MAPRTPKRAPKAEPFLTLSVPKSAAEKVLQILGQTTSTFELTPPVSVNKDSAVSTKNCSQPADGQSHYESAVASWSPPRKRKRASETTSPNSSLRIVTVKYRNNTVEQVTPQSEVNSELNLSNGVNLEVKTPGSKVHEKNQSPLASQAERRSSTASLTDGGTRSSARARKLTTKAQALAGTNFLPSLQKASDNRYSPSQINDQVVMEVLNDGQVISRQSTPETAVDEAPIESVETSTPRTSARERKPTVRAIELETSRTSRKRPVSPSSVERPTKMAKNSPAVSIKSSKLRHSTTNQDEMQQVEPEVVPVGVQTRSATKDDDVAMLDANVELPRTPSVRAITSNEDQEPIVEAAEEPKAEASSQNSLVEDSIIQSSGIQPSPAQEVGSEELASQGPLIQEPASQDLGVPQIQIKESDARDSLALNSQAEEDGEACDLKCLSQSASLLAFAKLAAEWPDSDEDGDNEDDIDMESTALPEAAGSSELLKKLRQQFCRCQGRNPVQQSSDQTRIKLKRPLDRSMKSLRRTGKGTGHADTSTDKLGRSVRKSEREKQKTVKDQPVLRTSRRQAIKHHEPTIGQAVDALEPQTVVADLDSLPASASNSHGSGHIQIARSQEVAPENARPIPSPFTTKSPQISLTHLVNGAEARKLDVQQISEKAGKLIGLLDGGRAEVDLAPQHKAVRSSVKTTFDRQKAVSKPSPLGGRPTQSAGKKTAAKIPISTSTTMNGVKGEGKASGRGPLRLTVHDTSDHIKPPNHKQSAAVLPHQTTSIKLRFTTSAK